jgi:hypothetical protein
MNRRKFFLAAGASGITLATPAAAQAWLRRRTTVCAPVAPAPFAESYRLRINISTVQCGFGTSDLLQGGDEVTVTSGCTIVVTTSLTTSQSSGRILKMSGNMSMAEGWPFIDDDMLWKLQWVNYSIVGAGQTLSVADPNRPFDPPFEITINVQPPQ